MKMSKANKRKYKSSGRQPCEICKRATYLEEHHLRGRNVENPHGDYNVCTICPCCHNEVHHGDIIIEGRFMTDHYELIWHNEGDESITGETCEVYLIQG
jgi:hypothetical protein